MGTAPRLSTDDRNFFSLVKKAIYLNPFGEERREVLVKLAPTIDLSAEEGMDPFLVKILPGLSDRIGKLDKKGLSRIEDFSDDDSLLVGYAYLLESYLTYSSELDGLIREQLRKPGERVTAPFLTKLVGDLERRGLEECDRYVALFYQLRRAYYFISLSLVGASTSMKELRHELWNNVFTGDVSIYEHHLWDRMEDFSTLIFGETGTGKGSAAAAIGRSGFIPFDRKKGVFTENFTDTFVSINLSQYPETIIESELFGHRKGAFTGAVDLHKGLFELCTPHGATFLDEIGEISVPVQIKLLGVLQERTFTPVGSHVAKRFSGRVIAATNRPVSELRGGGRLRDDFYYRLCSSVITVPTLRRRIEESPGELGLLVELLIRRLTGFESPELVAMVMECLNRDLPKGYGWPGNVRELEQAVRRILLTRHYGGDVEAADSDETEEEGFVRQVAAGELPAGALVATYCRLLYKKLGTYEDVARRTGLDRRTVKKHVSGDI